MKKSIYYLLSAIILLHTLFHYSQIVYAKENITAPIKNTSSFSLNNKHKQTDIIYDENNNMYITTIEPLSTENKIANGTYKISHTLPKKWTAYFYVKITGNKFSSCYSPHVTTLTGKVLDYSLKKNSNTSVILYIKHKDSLSIKTNKIKSVISNGKIKTSIL